MASPARTHPGTMPPDEAFVRLRRPAARAVAVHTGDGASPTWAAADDPTRSGVVLGTGPDEAGAWKDAAARARGWISFAT